MGYTIFTRDQVSPKFTIVHGAFGDETSLNLGAPPQFPAGASIIYQPEDLDIYHPYAIKRTILLSDPAGVASDADIFATFPLIREPQKAVIRSEGAVRLSALATPYTPEERETWATQQREARAWIADNTATVPMLSAMAAGRGISVETLAAKVMENVALFESTSGAILGEQQRLLDVIDSASTVAAMLAVHW